MTFSVSDNIFPILALDLFKCLHTRQPHAEDDMMMLIL